MTRPEVAMEIARSVGPSINVEEGCLLKDYVDIEIVPTQNDEAHTCQSCRQGKYGVKPRRASHRCSLTLRATWIMGGMDKKRAHHHKRAGAGIDKVPTARIWSGTVEHNIWMMSAP
ncbi:hypothetical protein QR685DRAFT_9803 [Neurospora intermedia]|uniref:Uncharacterized protein n=1 Tax=Neurospora intermedia TaxID=5142 RepID=A0ABR3DP54_NEUIN